MLDTLPLSWLVLAVVPVVAAVSIAFQRACMLLVGTGFGIAGRGRGFLSAGCGWCG